MLLAGLAVEKDNGFPRLDRRTSGHEKHSQCKQGHPLHGFIADRERGSRNPEVFCLRKMKENEPEPPVFETGSTDFKKT
jgi:hypothetical protein